MINPIKESVKALGHTPQYTMHKYFARRPYNVFNKLVEHYAVPNGIVLDCFCGGGVTVFESLALNRKVVGVDINPLATFISEMQIQQVDENELEKYFDAFYDECVEELNKYYVFKVAEQECIQEWMEWIYEVKCEKCGSSIILSDENKITNGKYRCPNPDCASNQTSKPGVSRTKCAPLGSVPIRIKYNDGGAHIHFVTESEKKQILDSLDTFAIPEELKQIDFSIPSNWDRWYEDCLPQKGIYRFSDLFSQRNYYVNTRIFNKILELQPSSFRDLLYFAFSSSLRYTNKMARVTENWENGNPTCMDKHAYWLPNAYVECNVLVKLKDRMKAVLKGLNYTNKTLPSKKEKACNFDELITGKDYMILTQSSANLPIPDASIDVVITDPPYGSNVQYAELSSFWNVWYKLYKGLDNFIYNEEEAVSNRKSCFATYKTVEFYGKMLCEVYKEAGRVLKPGGYLVFTFNNKDLNVWVQLLKAVVKAGFYLPEGGVIYQDFIDSYKNTSHLKYSGNIHGDFIYSFVKGDNPEQLIQVSDFESSVKNSITKCLKNMYAHNEAYTTTELYEKIYGSLISVIMGFVAQDDDLKEIDEFSKTYIDNLLAQNLRMEDNKWVLKEGATFA